MSGKNIKNQLKVFRAMRNWTQEDLARRVNVTRKTISTIEQGKFVPSTYLALKLAEVFKVKVEDLFQLNQQDIQILEVTSKALPGDESDEEN